MENIISKDLVISSYNEDTSWTSKIEENINVYLYNKDNRDNTIILPNIGREAQTYLYHICTQYNNLSDYVFFMQGHPFDHTGECIDIVNNNQEIWDKHCQMHYEGYWGYAHNSIGTMWVLDNCTQFNGTCLKSELSGMPHEKKNLPIPEVWDKIFVSPPPPILEFIPGAQFNISKKLILNRSINFWNELLFMSENIELFPWVFERMAPYVFHPLIETKIN